MPEIRGRRSTQSEALAGIAFVVAHLAMIFEVVRSTRPFGVQLAVAICFTNLLFAVFVRFVLRFRIVAVLAMFSMTAMTETLLWRSARDGWRASELAYAALQGMLVLAILSVVFHLLERDRRR